MTEQEAIKELQVGYLGDTEEIVQAKHMGIKAIEKQIPKKPKNAVYSRYDTFGVCPICDYCVVSQFGTPYNYCPKCGQKIDWSENNV